MPEEEGPKIVAPETTALPQRADKTLALELNRSQMHDPLPELRKRAEQYRNALVALTTLVTATWVVSGVTKAEDLTPVRRDVTGACLAIALLLLLVGSVLGMRAAYGSLKPTFVTTSEFGLAMEKEAVQTLFALRVGRATIVAAVVLMGIAVGTAFFNPKAASPPLVKATYRGGTVCGTLTGGDHSGLLIETVSDTGRQVHRTVPYSDLTAVRPVSQCSG